MAEHLSQTYVAKQLGVSRQAVNQLVKRGRIPVVEGTSKIPREWLESEDSAKRKHPGTKIPVEAIREIQGDFGASEDGESRGN